MDIQNKDVQMIAAAIDKVDESLVWIDFNGKILRANRQASQKSGYSAERICCMSIFEFCDSINQEDWPKMVRLLQQQETLQFECRVYIHHGLIVPMHISIHLQEENEDSLLLILNDYNKVHEHSMLERVKNEFNEITYRFTHDLRSPLSTIRGLINLMRMDNLPAQQHYLDKMESSVNKQSSIMTNMYLLACTHRTLLQTAPVQIEQVLKELLSEAGEGSDTFDWELEGSVDDTFESDHEMLTLLLLPILKNAVDYGDSDNPKVRVKYMSVKNGIQLDIQDNGSGIERAVKSRIFDMFYRGNIKSNGSGLGLYISRSAGLRLGARITFTTSTEGTVFQIFIPHSPVTQFELFPG